jgi:hypothetical protein
MMKRREVKIAKKLQNIDAPRGQCSRDWQVVIAKQMC